MSSRLDDQIRSALDRVRVAVAGQLEAELAASAADLMRARGEAEREAVGHAVADARLDTERQLEALREEFERERETLEQRHAAETVALEHRMASDTAAVEQRLASDAAALGRELSETRSALTAAREAVEEGRREREQLAHGAALMRGEAEHGRRAIDDAHAQVAAAREELDQLRVAFEARARALHDAERQCSELERQVRLIRARLDRAEHVDAGMRMLNEAASLGDVLDRLARAASLEKSRSAVFLVQDRQLRCWRAFGFEDAEAGAGLDSADPLVTEALRSRTSQLAATDLPGVARDSPARKAIAVPVEVGGSAIAVLYVDAARADTDEGREWLPMIEPMVHHASRVLEAMTLRQAADLWTPRSVAGPLSSPARRPSGPIEFA